MGKDIRIVFKISLWLKALGAVLEIIGGILFLFTGLTTWIIQLLVQGELIEDPTDFVAKNIQHYLPYFSQHAQLFVLEELAREMRELLFCRCQIRKRSQVVVDGRATPAINEPTQATVPAGDTIHP